jgi:hypothetical protein
MISDKAGSAPIYDRRYSFYGDARSDLARVAIDDSEVADAELCGARGVHRVSCLLQRTAGHLAGYDGRIRYDYDWSLNRP